MWSESVGRLDNHHRKLSLAGKYRPTCDESQGIYPECRAEVFGLLPDLGEIRNEVRNGIYSERSNQVSAAKLNCVATSATPE